MLTVALTGGIGSGKTEVSRFFSTLGAPVIDTDVISRQLVKPGSTGLQQITGQFGEKVLQHDGSLDRQKMRELVFNDKDARKTLENILHPLIRQEVNRQLENLSGYYAIIVIPLLTETGRQYAADRILVIDCPESLQRSRVLSRDNIDQALFEKILASQASRQERLAIADDVIVNDAGIHALKQQVTVLHQKYKSLGKGVS